MMKTIYLVRHGQASFGSQNYDQLSSNGRQQARYLAKYWQQKGISSEFYFSGQLERQIETASIVSGLSSASIEQLAGFNEYPFHQLFEVYRNNNRHSTDWRNVSKKEFQATLLKLFEQDIDKFLLDGGLLSWQTFAERCYQTLIRLISQHAESSSIAIFSSAGVIGALVQHVLSLTHANAAQRAFSLHNCAVTTLTLEKGVITLSQFNQTNHLGSDLSSDLYSYL